MKYLLILIVSFGLICAQNLTLKKNNKTATVTHNQPVVIVSKNKDVFNGRFQKIEDNSIILEGRTIAIDQVKEIKLPYSRLKSAYKGFRKGGLVCGGITAGFLGCFHLGKVLNLIFLKFI